MVIFDTYQQAFEDVLKNCSRTVIQ